MENVNAHYARMEIAGAKYSILPLWALLNATVRDPKKQVPSPVVSGATVRAVFSGTPYPVSLMEAVLASHSCRAKRYLGERRYFEGLFGKELRTRKRSFNVFGGDKCAVK